MRTKSKWSPGPGIKVKSVVSDDDGDWVVSAGGASSGICPDCRKQSRSRHGWSYRSLQDLPTQGNEVTVRLRLSRWRCSYRQCERQTFTDPIPEIAAPYARRTTRVAKIVGLLGHGIVSEAASSVSPVQPEPSTTSHPRRKRSDVTIELGRGRRVRVDSDIDTDALGRILDCVLGLR